MRLKATMKLKTKWKFLFFAVTSACVLNFLPVAADEHGAACDCYECLAESWSIDQQKYLAERCLEYDLDLSVLKAVAWNESRFQPDATHVNTNGTTDWGMFQINDSCYNYLHDEIGLDSMPELLDPYTNIDAAVTLMRYHKDATGDDALALMRYQCGEGNFKKKLQQGIYSTQTQQRVLRVAQDVKEVDAELLSQQIDVKPTAQLSENPVILINANSSEIIKEDSLPKRRIETEQFRPGWYVEGKFQSAYERPTLNILANYTGVPNKETFGALFFGPPWDSNAESVYVTVGYTSELA